MPAKMQLLIRCNGRIFLAICLILFVGYTAQALLRCSYSYRGPLSNLLVPVNNTELLPSGAPVQKARYKRVRCRPDSWSANCIEETGPWFHMPTGGANRILPPMANPSLMKQYQELADTFPLSEELSGSGFDGAVEAEPASGSGLGESEAFFQEKLPVLLAGPQGGELKRKLTEEDLLL